MANKYDPAEQGIDVTERQKKLYENAADNEEARQQVTKAWKRAKRIKKITFPYVLLTTAVTIFVPWYIYHDRQDLLYFFSSRDAAELGDAGDYHLAYGSEKAKEQNFTDNSYVHIKGIPIRHVAIEVPGNPFLAKDKKLVYQLMGSSVYVQEEFQNSQYANFVSQTSATFGAGQGISLIDIKGRLRRFDTNEAKQYAPLREYYSKTYNTQFCENMSEDEYKRKVAMLGHGGVALQIMPDGSVLEGTTNTHDTLTKVQPLRGGAAMVVGNNTLLHTANAGLTWNKADLTVDAQLTSLAFNQSQNQVLLAGRKGFVGTDKNAYATLLLSQDITDISFTAPEADDLTAPRIIAVGREGLIEIATPGVEGMIPAPVKDVYRFNAALEVGGTWFVAGSQNMLLRKSASSLDDPSVPWTSDVSPAKAEWLSLIQAGDLVIATGTKGAIAQYKTDDPSPHWTPFPVDDVPGIDFTSDLRSSALSGDGKTWVAVGDNGAIVVAQADETGKFKPAQRISSSYAGYGVVRDILAGNSVEQALYETLQRYTKEDLYDITWHDGTFYAVGANSLLMTSKDGLSWTKQQLLSKKRLLRSVAFIDDQTGVIGGEKGTMLLSENNGETWRSHGSATERSIYHIAPIPNHKGSFIIGGAFGLWSICKSVRDRCVMRSSTAGYHYQMVVPSNQAPRDIAHLELIGVSNNAQIQHIYDAPGAQQVVPLWNAGLQSVNDMLVASEALPLMPNSARGHVALVSVGNGTIYRSMDAGYTFNREETGVSAPLRHLTATGDGSVVWAFDRKGVAIEDLRGMGQWHPLDNGRQFIDGVIIGETGYLVDQKCIYKRDLAKNETEMLSCIDSLPGSDQLQISHLARDSQDRSRIDLLLRHESDLAAPYQTAVLELGDAPALTGLSPANLQLQAGDVVFTPDPADSELISCQGTMILIDKKQHVLFSSLPPQLQVSDAACMLSSVLPSCDTDKLAILSVIKEDNKWTLSAASDTPLWRISTGIDASGAQFIRNHDGRWMVSMGAPTEGMPGILMSRDGERWSWRRDRITDYHAVDTALNKAVTVGDNSEILLSEDYGASWSVVHKGTGTLRDVCLSKDGSFGVAVGDNGTLYRAQNGLNRWQLRNRFEFDITSCAIVDMPDRFEIYIGGKGGAIYSTKGKEMSHWELVASPVMEDIYSMAALDSGHVLAVGGVYQDPAALCEEGYIIEADETPGKQWPSVLIAVLLLLFWGYNLQTFGISWKHRNDIADD